MIKVVHLITNLNMGGAEVMLHKIVSGSDRSRVRSIVVSMTGEGTLGPQIRALGIPLHTLKASKGPSAITALFRFFRLLRREKPDVLQTWLYDADLCGLIVGRIVRIPAIVWNIRCSDRAPIYQSGFGKLVISALARCSRMPNVVIANSKAGIREHERLGYRPKRWQALANGFDLETFRPNHAAYAQVREQLQLNGSVLLIGLVARFDALKGQQNFLHAAGILNEAHPDVHFVMVGPGITHENAALRGMIAEAGIADDRLHLLGERQDIAEITAALDIATCASIAEGFPNVVGEAMACGVPCAVTDVGDSSLIVGETGKVVPPANPSALAAAWSELIEMGPEGRQMLGTMARQRIEEQFSLPAICAQYDALYEELAAR